MENSLQIFVDNYSEKDFDKIKFDWNGKHAEEFVDNNYDFRMNVVNNVVQDINSANIMLVKDLYIECCKSAKETWGAPNSLSSLAQELIVRDHKKYLLDYLKGVGYSMDTYLASGILNISTELAAEIVQHIIILLETEKDDEIIKSLKIGLERFNWLSTKEN